MSQDLMQAVVVKSGGSGASGALRSPPLEVDVYMHTKYSTVQHRPSTMRVHVDLADGKSIVYSFAVKLAPIRSKDPKHSVHVAKIMINRCTSLEPSADFPYSLSLVKPTSREVTQQPFYVRVNQNLTYRLRLAHPDVRRVRSIELTHLESVWGTTEHRPKCELMTFQHVTKRGAVGQNQQPASILASIAPSTPPTWTWSSLPDVPPAVESSQEIKRSSSQVWQPVDRTPAVAQENKLTKTIGGQATYQFTVQSSEHQVDGTKKAGEKAKPIKDETKDETKDEVKDKTVIEPQYVTRYTDFSGFYYKKKIIRWRTLPQSMPTEPVHQPPLLSRWTF